MYDRIGAQGPVKLRLVSVTPVRRGPGMGRLGQGEGCRMNFAGRAGIDKARPNGAGGFEPYDEQRMVSYQRQSAG
jgi:hypothetical protein